MDRSHRDEMATVKKDLRIGTWNVLSLYRPGALKVLEDQLSIYAVDILAIQEIRWLGTGTMENNNYNIYYSCNPKEHIFGTGFIISKRVKHLVIDFQAINHRLCYIRIKGRFFNYSLICAHAPTETTENEEEKDCFYDDLEQAYIKCPKHDVKIILGDMNAKIGKEWNLRAITGAHSLHESTNNNGMRLVQLAMSLNMVIGSTLFPKKDIHKGTWLSPDGETCNQIDHFLIDANHRSDLINVRTYRGENVDSDHYLVIATIRAKINSARRMPGHREEKYNYKVLETDKYKEDYKTKLEEKMQNLDLSINESSQQSWENLRNVIQDVTTEVLGKSSSQKRKEGWFDKECEEATKKKNEAYKVTLQGPRTRSVVAEYKQRRRKEKSP